MRARPPFRLYRLAAAFFLLALAAGASAAQEAAPSARSTGANSGANPGAQPGNGPGDGPAAVLRDVLAAACAQDQQEFARFLTARNARSFARLSAPSRVALMKRFVLLDQPGKPGVTENPSGRPVVACATPALTHELQIGGADIQENLAFLPLEIRAMSGASAGGVRRIQMGLVREDGGWKLLSVGLLLLDLPSLEVEWNRASLEGNEREALEALKSLAQAVEAYRRAYTRLPESLAQLGPPAKGPASAKAAGLAGAELAAGAQSGYAFRYVIAGASDVGAPAKYELAATPQAYGTTGRRSFFRDASGILHAADRQGAVGSEADPTIE
ncbi:MAG: hypothetical protein LAN84_03260 [Acidobacteriia bacterium]|nr:hypothetical protein [Terriglobia bacterium]